MAKMKEIVPATTQPELRYGLAYDPETECFSIWQSGLCVAELDPAASAKVLASCRAYQNGVAA
jgi:hypothetical protein